jgi:tripartite-type tricarboxylate transporter receptor subunit TctC
MFDIVPISKSLAETGRVRILAVTSETRNPMLPDVQSISEGGISDFAFTFWQGMSLPKNTPDDIAQIWLNAAKATVADEEVKSKLHQQGYQIVVSSPDEFKSRMNSEFELWAKLIAETGIKV